MGDTNKENRNKGYIIKFPKSNDQVYIKDIVEAILRLNNIERDDYKIYKIISKEEIIETDIIEELYDEYNFEILMDNIKDLHLESNNNYFLVYIALLKEYFTKDELAFIDKYKDGFNHLLSYDVFKNQSGDILDFYKENYYCDIKNIDSIKNIKHLSILKDFMLLNKNQCDNQNFINIIKSDISNEYKVNKIYQLMISFALSKHSELINKLNLIKSFDFNGIFFKKNLQYFNPKEISIYQSVRSKDVKSPVSIIKEECEEMIHFEDIDYLLLDNLFGEIYRDNITTPYINVDTKEGKKDIVEFYYKMFESSEELLGFIDDFNNGEIIISKYNMCECSFNEYVHSEYDKYLTNEDILFNINESSKLYGLFGEFGCIVLRNSFNKLKKKTINLIEVKGNIDTELFISIVKTYSIDKEHDRKVIINLLYQPN